jgi:hypothetical protein
MKRQLAALLLLIHISVNTEAGQLFRLPSLIRHYQKHQQEHSGYTLTEFLLKHYAGDEGNDADHDQLPFHDFSHSSMAIVFAPMVNPPTSSSILFEPEGSRSAERSEGLITAYTDCLLQPPRLF